MGMLDVFPGSLDISATLLYRLWQHSRIHADLQNLWGQSTLRQPRFFQLHDAQVRFNCSDAVWQAKGHKCVASILHGQVQQQGWVCCAAVETTLQGSWFVPNEWNATPQDERANDFPMLVFAHSRDHFHHQDTGLQDAQESPSMQCEAAISSHQSRETGSIAPWWAWRWNDSYVKRVIGEQMVRSMFRNVTIHHQAPWQRIMTPDKTFGTYDAFNPMRLAKGFTAIPFHVQSQLVCKRISKSWQSSHHLHPSTVPTWKKLTCQNRGVITSTHTRILSCHHSSRSICCVQNPIPPQGPNDHKVARFACHMFPLIWCDAGPYMFVNVMRAFQRNQRFPSKRSLLNGPSWRISHFNIIQLWDIWRTSRWTISQVWRLSHGHIFWQSIVA